MEGSTTVDVPIPIEAEAAATLEQDRERRNAVGRLVSLVLRPQAGRDPLLEAMDRLSGAAQELGLTDGSLAAELAAHKAERRR